MHSASEWAELGASLRNARLKAGLTQVEVAARFGRAQSMIANIERGERQLTALELRDLCRIFHVSSSSVLDDENSR